MSDDNRSAIGEQVIRAGSMFEGVRVAQRAPVGTSQDDLVSMAVSSVTKNCEVQQWSPAILVKDILRNLYLPPEPPGTSRD